jgi:hypothetical protein
VQPLLTLSQANNTSGNTWGIDFKRTTGTGAGDLVAKIHANREGGDATGITFGINKADGSLIEAGRFNSAGFFLVGSNSSTFNADAKIVLAPDSDSNFTNNSQVLSLNRTSTDGAIVGFYKDQTGIGSIASRGGEFIAVGSGDTNLEFNFGSDQINPSSGTAARDNAIDLGATGSRFKDAYLSGGVFLGGTDAAHKLSDVESGTWTPTLGGNTDANSYNIQAGYYRKVGSIVYFYGELRPSSIGTGSTTQISGLPFTAAHSGGYQPGYYDGAASSIEGGMQGVVQATALTMRNKSSASNAIGNVDFWQNNARHYFSGTYITDS